MSLELLAMRFLRWEKRCAIVLRERSTREYTCGRPDVLGVTDARCLLEIEIKRSLQDFKADNRKRRCQPLYRKGWAHLLPKQLWYLVPPEILKRVEPLVPEWAGLMRGPGRNEVPQVYVVKPAPTNPDHKRLSLREAVKMCKLVSNYAVSCEETNHARFSRFKDGWCCWPEPDFEI